MGIFSFFVFPCFGPRNMSMIIWIPLIFLALQHQLSYSSAQNFMCNNQESLALFEFKNSLKIDTSASTDCTYSSPKTLSWHRTADCCKWDGVSCDKLTGNVIDLDLSCSQLQGTILNNSTLFQLTHLQRLNLACNGFSFSGLPRRFGQFASLTHLNLSDSGLSGHITSEISNLSKLISLDLSRNIDEPVLSPHSFNLLLQNLTFLEEVFLYSVQINSVLPKNLSSSLTYLDFSSTGMYGKLPDEIFQLPNLRGLKLESNYGLIGHLPTSKWNCSLLEVLSLSETGLSGELPDSMSQMKSLTNLDLSGCEFSGSISDAFGNLTQISQLLLFSNNFSGQLPSRLSNLEHLTQLDLSYNHFEGQIPDDFGKLKKLTDLSLGGGNNFHGKFPSSLANLTLLESLDLSNNALTGQIPSNGTSFQNLKLLFLSANLLEGTLPAWLFSLPSFGYLDLGSNQLSGQLHEFQSNSMKYIDLSNNKLQGPLPLSISELVNLTTLYLQSNNFSGDVDISIFSNINQLRFLDLSDNSLSLRNINKLSNATLPGSLGSIFLASCGIEKLDFLRNATSLGKLDLANNNIQGQIPDWALYMWSDTLYYLNLSGNFLTSFNKLPLNNLVYLDLRSNLLGGQLIVPPATTVVFFISKNKLTGQVPSSICNSSSLLVLDMSHNSLGGELPECLGVLGKKLSVLNLQTNRFHGTIPRTFPKGCRLRNLNLNGNNLAGTVPRSLANCKQLEVLDLGNNAINGTWPNWLATLPNLQVLVLRNNRFHGPISSTSKTKSAFLKLRIIDLSYNDFSGLLPSRYIKSFKAMMNTSENGTELSYMGNSYYQDSVTVVIKGQQYELERILTIFTTIDLSSNNFSGEIPTFFGNLGSLLVLNLSHNSLAGHIPSFLGNAVELESLDLSSNQLTGEIPQILTALTFLAVLNVSYNQLVGRIPRGDQFNTFQNDSYSGNVGLCGFPLSKECTENTTPETPLVQEEEDDSDFINGFTWPVVLLGYGCGTVFGLGMGYLMFVTGKPKWFTRIIDDEQRRILRRRKRN